MNRQHKKNIAIFASGTGTNAANITRYFQEKKTANVAMILSNNPQAGVLKIGAGNNIPTVIIEKEKFFKGDAYVPELKNASIDFIVLAGFLWKVPLLLINAYRDKIINIHPALLPKFGGKGMYGEFVHKAVLAAKENKSGITIHFVDEVYDNGKIIFQAICPVYETDTTELLANRIHQMEYEHFPKVIEHLVTG